MNIEDRNVFINKDDKLKQDDISEVAKGEKELCFGVISDIQYADIDDAYSAWG